MQFSTKAETLKLLTQELTGAIVLPQYLFEVKQWQHNRDLVLSQFFSDHQWATSALVVRSSGIAEDSQSESLAGHFDSVVNVQGKDALIAAIEQVASSFGDNSNDKDQIFIQPMLQNVLRSGVVFTLEPSTNSPYYVINYSTDGDTENVTSGSSNESLIYVAKSGTDKPQNLWVQKLILLCQQLEQTFGSDSLDIEFAFDHNEQLYLFQVRPLITQSETKTAIADHQQLLQQLYSTIERLTKPHPYLNGAKSVLGVMPDWNPAEIIGIRPTPLALSLYKELVTDSTWAYQRNNYGYKQLRSFPLLVNLAGLPYIDVRVSFNSFIPADVPDDLAEKLVNHYINQLENSPEKHDKVEFDIIFSCFTLDVEKRLEKLLDHGFNVAETRFIQSSLVKLTNNIIKPDGLWVQDIRKINQLPARREKILNSNLTKIEKVYWLLEDCKRYGTLPFAGLARAGFIAVQFLKSMISVGLLGEQDYERFMHSLETVSSSMSKDKADMSFAAFLKKYGHLRPGTYDIVSPRYDQEPEKYFNVDTPFSDAEHTDSAGFTLSLAQLENLKQHLEQQGIDHDVISIFKFIKGAIEGREYAKFVFSRSLSDALLLIEQLGDEMGISKQDIAYANIKTFNEAYSSAADMHKLLQNAIATGKENYQATESLVLPPLIVKPSCVYCFEMPENEPNFITMKQVTANTQVDLEQTSELSGKIAFIPSADPGFDWLFSHNIGGLVTKFGGANSHMAIRAGELGIPSVIGAGEVLYEKWSKAELIALDASNKKVTILK